jgi:hypothetical protein
MSANKPAPVKAGAIVSFDRDNPKNAAVVIETATNKYDDDTEQSYALIAKLPTELVPLDSVWSYGSDPEPAEAQVKGSDTDTATGIG